MRILGYFLFAVGTLLCCLNFYLCFLRIPLNRMLGRQVKWASGIPLFGSMLLVIAVFMLRDSAVLFWTGIAIAMLDTGGLHWAAGTMIWYGLFRRDAIGRG